MESACHNSRASQQMLFCPSSEMTYSGQSSPLVTWMNLCKENKSSDLKYMDKSWESEHVIHFLEL
jgi:hypothetical protein